MSNASFPAGERLTPGVRRQSGTHQACPGRWSVPVSHSTIPGGAAACSAHPGWRQPAPAYAPGPQPSFPPWAWSPGLVFCSVCWWNKELPLPLSLPEQSLISTDPAIINEAKNTALWVGLGPICSAVTSPGSPDGDGISSLPFFHFQASPYLLPTPPTHNGGTAHKHVQNYLITL